MRRLVWALLALLLFCPVAAAEGLEGSLADTLDRLPLEALEAAYEQAEPEGSSLKESVLSLARGETTLDGAALLSALARRLLSALSGSVWRFARLIAPAVFCGVAGKIRASFAGRSVGEAAQSACFLLLAGFMTQDLSAHAALAQENIRRMADLMQSLFPLLLTLLAAVGGTASAAFFQPTVVAACGTMTEVIRTLTLPLALGAAGVTLLNHLTEKIRLGRLAALLKTGATWTLGVSFTVFLSVTTLQSLGTAAADGVSIRTAKYAVDNFVPIVGGMFADTMDTLVGASLLIKNALGITGLTLLIATACAPMLETLAAVMIYRACAALLEPVSDGAVVACLQEFSDILMLLFVIQLSVGAMFLLLVAQMLVVGNLTVMLR